MNSNDCSRDIALGVVNFKASSEPEDLVFVNCFLLHTLTSKSSALEDSPTIIPSYTSTPAPINKVPLS
ncbi:hypothetical protein D3C73_1637880 [compost metagenome]